MSLKALRTLLAIARHGAFARAADAVGLTQSAVSLQVKALEEEFGAQLFDRTRRQPTLTEAGRIVLARAEEVLALYDRIPDALSDERALAGRLRLGAVQTALSGPVPDALVLLRRAHPRLRVHVAAGMSAELARRVSAGGVDGANPPEPGRAHPPHPRRGHPLAGRLRLGAVQTALSGPVPDALVLLRRAHPRLRVHVAAGMSAELARRVSAGELDAAITTEPVRPHPPDLVWDTLYEDRFWVLAPPEHEGRDPRELPRD